MIKFTPFLRGTIWYLFFCLPLLAQDFPAQWWAPVDESERQSWEILPQDMSYPDVVLSKRTALGVFSNLAHSPFDFEGETYSSVEAFWQMMKYPENDGDPRWAATGWPYTREEVKKLSGFAAKRAGDAANEFMKKLGIKWVSYRGRKFDYKDLAQGSQFHYELIRQVMEKKLRQNPAILDLLFKTRGLNLHPDHKIDDKAPAAYHFHKIFMELRQNLGP